jgi:ribosome-associated protein
VRHDGPVPRPPADRPPIRDVPLDAPIRLGQFLKLARYADDGAHARDLVEAGAVRVNGRVETRRGAQLHHGDVVEVDGVRARPTAP